MTLEIAEKEVIKAAAIAYVFPPLMMIIGYLVTDKLGFSENQSILGSFIGLILAFIGLFIYDKFFAKKSIEEEIRVISVEDYDPTKIEKNTSCEL